MCTVARVRTRSGADSGFALPMVLITMTVLTLFLLTGLAVTLQNMAPARADQDSKAALAAAQAGIDEYISRLNSTSGNYWEKGNVDATNAAFTAAGVDVPGTGGAGASFRYQLLTDQSTTAKQGYITLRVTGTSAAPSGQRPVSRTLTTTLRPKGFIDFIYYTDVEATDPDLYKNRGSALRNGASRLATTDPLYQLDRAFVANATRVASDCAKHYYNGRQSVSYTATSTDVVFLYDASDDAIVATYTSGTVSAYCREIQWTTGDVVVGPLHSNDALQIQGSVLFTDPKTQSAWATPPDPTKRWWGAGTPSTGTAAQPGYRPVQAGVLSLPAGNQQLLKYVRPKIDMDPNPDSNRLGCLYTGATRIIFQGTTMKILSPNTTAASTPSHCLDVASAGSEQTKPIPPVIYVKSLSGTCTGVGYPRLGEDTTNRITTNYAPCRGTAFVQGTVDAQVTVSGEDDIVVTGDIRVQDAGAASDIVGLVARNNVWVYHPVRDDGSNLVPSAEWVHNIEAGVLSLTHSFVVQNYDAGAKLTTSETTKLRVFGAIAQKFRGPVGTGNGVSASTGYLKNYVYDDRLRVLQPPYFLSPDNAPWEPVQVTDG